MTVTTGSLGEGKLAAWTTQNHKTTKKDILKQILEYNSCGLDMQ